MTTPQPNQLPEEVKPPYKISEREPVFPCWLWLSCPWEPMVPPCWLPFNKIPVGGFDKDKITHWSPDQPDAPTVRPGGDGAPLSDLVHRGPMPQATFTPSDTPRTDAAFYGEHDNMLSFSDCADFARTLERQLTALTAERDHEKLKAENSERLLLEFRDRMLRGESDFATLRQERDALRGLLVAELAENRKLQRGAVLFDFEMFVVAQATRIRAALEGKQPTVDAKEGRK